jgi:hypothetical protein
MNNVTCPNIVGGAKVVLFTPIDERHRYTVNTKNIVAGVSVGPVSGLAIGQYPGENAFYLFACDEQWQSVTDSWHQTLEGAQSQAEFEYEGVSKTWVYKS